MKLETRIAGATEGWKLLVRELELEF